MSKYPPPDREGYYWAKLVHPSKMPEGEDWASPDWEIVEVCNNNVDDPEDDEHWIIFVPGIGPPQWWKDFIWGPRVKDRAP